MPFLIALLSAAGIIAYFVIRARNATNAASELMDVANDVRLAARRFGFRRQSNLHPAESIEDPNLAISALASAFIELDDLPTQDQRAQLEQQLQTTLNMDRETTQEAMVLGRWLVSECGGADAAVSRLSRKLYRLSGAEALQPLLTVIKGTLGDATTGLSPRQKEAIEDLSRVFRVK